MPKAFPVALFVACLSSTALAADVTGDWFVAEKTAVIRVLPCGGTGMCGYIGWTKNAPPGATDKNNPDPAKRNRPVIGLQMLTMKAAAAKNRYEGEIYNGEEGKVYTGSIQLVNDMTLRIEGCVLGFLCGGQNWTRAKCDDPPAAAAPPAGGRPAAPPGAARATPVGASPIPTQPLTGCRAASP
jgi:uncharacterized protein (DUF2147 family)